jgi:hypothetical protein
MLAQRNEQDVGSRVSLPALEKPRACPERSRRDGARSLRLRTGQARAECAKNRAPEVSCGASEDEEHRVASALWKRGPSKFPVGCVQAVWRREALLMRLTPSSIS